MRNPFTRSLSTFNFLKGWPHAPEDLVDLMARFPNFERFVMSPYWLNSDGPDGILRPQMAWLRSSADDPKLLVDFVGRIETIHQDLSTILTRIEGGPPEASPESLENLNPSDERGHTDWPPEVVKRIAHRYAEDFLAFGYDPRQVPTPCGQGVS